MDVFLGIIKKAERKGCEGFVYCNVFLILSCSSVLVIMINGMKGGFLFISYLVYAFVFIIKKRTFINIMNVSINFN